MTTAETARPRIVPPRPEPPERDVSAFGIVRAMRDNALAAWPRRAYEADGIERRLFGRKSVILNSPQAVRHILIDHPERYGRTPATLRVLRPLLGEGLLLSEGQAWRHQRRTLAPAFTPRAVEVLTPHIARAVEDTVAELARTAGRPVDLFGAVQRLALTIAGRTMFSLEMGASGPALRDHLVHYGERLTRPRLLDVVLPLSWPNPHDLARRRFRRRWTAFLDGLLAERLAQPAAAGAPRDLLDLMLAARDPETGAAFSPEQLRDQVATMILAGHETTALTLFWSLYLLALDPAAQETAADEGARALKSGPPRLDALPFTRAVIDEAMRLYPPAFVIVRLAQEADAVGGFALTRGDVALLSPWILHRHRRLWDDPDAFRPERFLPGAAPIDRFAYLPFGAGPRVCIGAHFALTEAVLALTRLLTAFRIGLVGARPVLPVAVVTTQPDHAPAFRLERRQPA